MAEYGKTRPHHIQILFTVFSKANQVKLEVVNGGGSTQYSGGLWRSVSGNPTVSCKAAEGVFAVVDMGAVRWPRLELIYSENQHCGNTYPVYDQTHPMSCSC